MACLRAAAWAPAWAAWITKPKLNMNRDSRASKEARLFRFSKKCYLAL